MFRRETHGRGCRHINMMFVVSCWQGCVVLVSLEPTSQDLPESTSSAAHRRALTKWIWRFFRQFLWIDWYKEQTMMHIETSDQKCKFHRSREGLSILMLDGNMMRRPRPRDYDLDIFRMMSQSLGRPAVQ